LFFVWLQITLHFSILFYFSKILLSFSLPHLPPLSHPQHRPPFLLPTPPTPPSPFFPPALHQLSSSIHPTSSTSQLPNTSHATQPNTLQTQTHSSLKRKLPQTQTPSKFRAVGPHTQTHGHTQPSSSSPSTSYNPDFTVLVKNLFRHSQLQYHINNWTHLPNSIQSSISSVFQSIFPPMPTSALQSSLHSIQLETSNKIHSTVLEHLHTQLSATDSVLRSLNAWDLDIDRASTMAKNQLIRQLKSSPLPPSTLDSLISNSVSKLIQLPTTTSGSSPIDLSSTSASTSLLIQPQPKPQRFPRCRIPISIPINVVSNPTTNSTTSPSQFLPNIHDLTHFPLLTPVHSSNSPPHTPTSPTILNLSHILDEFLISTPPAKSSITHSRKLPNTSTPTPTHSTLQDLSTSTSTVPLTSFHSTQSVTLHYKSDTYLNSWPISQTADTLILGDSNLRHWHGYPPSWSVHCFPGWKLQHACKLISEAQVPSNIKQIVFSVGLNDRDSSFYPHLSELHSLSSSLRIPVFFLTVYCPLSSPSHTRNSIAAINLTALQLFTNRLIPGPSDTLVTPLPQQQDHLGIHYTASSSSLFINAISNYLSLCSPPLN